ncbi:MAG TPA: hypothetical protein VEF53_19305 [Patescibacteria group bacterium]|nr:hypothetical protein [Patescibacteria group bacterium]
MNNMYNEIYGLYYFMLEKILSEAGEAETTLRNINSIVSHYGFSESNLYFTPDAISRSGTGYNLLKTSDSGYSSILKSSPESILLTCRRAS